MRRSIPEGTVMRAGARRSTCWRSPQARGDFSASPSSASDSASSRVLPAKAGFSQSSRVACRAASDRSGRPSSGIHCRSETSRACHWRRPSVHGNATSPSSRTASVRAWAAWSGSTRPAGRLSSTMRSKRDSRLATSARLSASQTAPSRSTKRSRKSARRNASSTGAARSSRASPRASWRNSLATSQGSPRRALSSNRRALRPLASW